jgi:hypothetical protein
VVKVKFKKDNLILSKNGKKVVLPLKDVSPKLFEASEEERNLFKVSPSGYGIHWPLIDEDISIKTLVKKA